MDIFSCAIVNTLLSALKLQSVKDIWLAIICSYIFKSKLERCQQLIHGIFIAAIGLVTILRDSGTNSKRNFLSE